MSVYNIYVQTHAAHIGLIAKLLNLNFVLISSITQDHVIDSWRSEYEYMLNKLAIWASEYHDFELWQWYLKNKIIYTNVEIVGGIDIIINDGLTLNDTVTNFLILLNNDISGYLVSSFLNRISIRKTIELIQGRIANDDEVELWNERTGKIITEKINYFSFVMILNFNKEARQIGLHIEFINLFKDIKYKLSGLKIPIIGIIMCGHSREFALYITTHKVFIENIYIDIFIHTWNKQGPRRITNDKELTNIVLLINTYKPRKILIEELELKIHEFSLLGQDNLLFFKHDQEKDDASFYVNANLYSLYKASLLLKEYELEKGFTYNGILKMPFDYEIKQFTFSQIYKDIINDKNHLYLPLGCNICTMEVEWPYLFKDKYPGGPESPHAIHMNDIEVYWMYGKREIMLKACELYLYSFAIANDVLDENIAAYVNNLSHRKFREFVYILGHDYIEKNIYEINNLPVRVWGFYLQNLYRIYMKDFMCIGTNYDNLCNCKSKKIIKRCVCNCNNIIKYNSIIGKFSKFDLDRGLRW